MFFYRGTDMPTKKSETRNTGLALIQTKGAMRMLRSYAEISSRTTK
jgi:hypothetical protein